jgi:hypothetical protein
MKKFVDWLRRVLAEMSLRKEVVYPEVVGMILFGCSALLTE